MRIEFIDENQSLERISEKIELGIGGILAVAFWGEGAVKKLKLNQRPKKSPPLEIICNLTMGGTNPYEIEKIINLDHISVYHNNKIHGKVYLFEDAVIVGSSNASANGLSFEGNEILGWKEANIFTDHIDVLCAAKEWCANLERTLLHSHSCELEHAKEAWKARRENRGTGGVQKSIQEIVSEDVSFFKDRNVYVLLYDEELSEDAKSELREFNKKQETTLEAFEDWHDIPRGSPLICFYRGKKSVRFEGIYEVLKGSAFDHKSLQLCRKIDKSDRNLMGIKDPNEKEEKEFWKKYIGKFLEYRANQNNIVIKIDDFIGIIQAVGE